MKRNITRAARMVAAATAVTLVATACGSGGGSDSDNPYDGVTLRFLRHAGYDAELMQEKLADFTAETGIEVEMDTVPYSDLHNKQVLELSGGGGSYDVTAVPDFWLGEYQAAGWLRPLDDYLADEDLYDPDFDIDGIPDALLEANRVDGQLLALPWKFNTLIMFYRSDLIEQPPVDWDAWLASARAASGDGVSGVGLSLAPASFTELFMDLVVLNGGQFLNDEGTEAAFNSAEGVAALEFLRELTGVSPQGYLNRTYDDNAALMAQGATATDLLVPYQASVVEGDDSQVAGDIGYATLPPATAGEPSTSKLNTWALAVTAGSPNPEAAYQLVQYLMSPDLVEWMTTSADGAIVPARADLLTRLQDQYPSFASAEQAAQNAWSYPKLPEISSIENLIATELQATLAGGGSAQAGLDAAAAAVNRELDS
ncbi:extracellular solute-binding protein [Verrucosispora sp. WMMD573]|uniref:extracellular solute-binding protein n=1 Tax=Verrucosispora sp. WMMD573 TaxID=3015149 RepID=UPI00248C58C3|nr:extracellular solute-binding protein [Verrucosispora sp. WMMD573]WBB54436.1 extracellular solute-binding protein [Verrucosispora sp. WMMD573]